MRLVRRYREATTSFKNVETLPRKNDLSFLLQIAPSHRSVRYNTDLPPPSHSKLFLQVYGLVLFATLIRGGGGTQAQDRGQAIYAKIWYSVSSTVLLQLVVAFSILLLIISNPGDLDGK